MQLEAQQQRGMWKHIDGGTQGRIGVGTSERATEDVQCIISPLLPWLLIYNRGRERNYSIFLIELL